MEIYHLHSWGNGMGEPPQNLHQPRAKARIHGNGERSQLHLPYL